MATEITHKDIVLLVSHFVDDTVIKRYWRLHHNLDSEKYDIVLLLNMEDIPDKLDIPAAAYSYDRLNELGYIPICDTLLPGSCHFTLLAFYKDNPQYRNYWFIEYDVLYTGHWSDFMNEFDDDLSDFISCEVEKYDPDKNGRWTWWSLLNDCGYPPEMCVRGFNPICRYSNDALDFLDKYQNEGHSGHSEVLITTSLYHAGFRISDIGANSEFSNPERDRMLYIPNNSDNKGTVRWKPSFTPYEKLMCGMLYHPVKSLHPIENILQDINGRSTKPLGAE